MADSITRQLIISAAEARGLTVSFLGRDGFFCKVSDQKGNSELFLGSRPLKSSANGLITAIHKDLTLEYVESLGYKVPAYRVVESAAGLPVDFLEQHKTVVVKPNDGEQSIGVTTNVITKSDLAKAVGLARANSRFKRVMVQEQLYGQLYRIFVINGKLVATAKREAATVIGDGVHSLSQLVDNANQDPRRGEGTNTPLKIIKLSEAEAFLGSEMLQKVPQKNERVKVSAIDSVSAGGEATDVTELVHPDWAKAAADIAKQIDLYVCGFDVICADISQPLKNNYLPLLEMNSSPGFKLHQYPTGGGKPINLADTLLDELFGIAKSS